MSLTRQEFSRILYPDTRGQRFTQDTPIQLSVWLAYAVDWKESVPPAERTAHLLLEPHSSKTIGDAVQAVKGKLAEERGESPKKFILPFNESHILATLTFRELLRVMLPLTSWWGREIRKRFYPDQLRNLPKRADFLWLLLNPAYQDRELPSELLDFIRIAGAILKDEPIPLSEEEQKLYFTDAVDRIADLYEGADVTSEEKNKPVLFQAALNRTASTSVWRSRLAVKADAALLLFSIRCTGLTWAVVDSGVDARHPAFRRIDKPKPPDKDESEWSRIKRTFDFTRIRDLLGGEFTAAADNSVFASLPEAERKDIQSDLRRRLSTGQQVDWNLLLPFMEVKHGAKYPAPEHEHGTHVAGILAANQANEKPAEKDLVGVCPDLELFDVRVIDKFGQGDEFSILAALQFLRFLNSHSDRLLVHGANLSFSIPHAVDSYACGETPVCQECRRLVGSGVVVVAAAGNRGYRGSLGAGAGADPAIADAFEDYRNISITDPGNAEEVITVGSTHRFQPHKYGVSYFSSRGPTGDGRSKPDIVAPGEKVESCTPDNRRAALDGTSMAAPHVSGAAALLMARHRELIGRPVRIKEILCKSATDLGRERAFQGAGMLDILRALQSV